MDDKQKAESRERFSNVLNLISSTDDPVMRAGFGEWLITYLEAGNPVPDSTDTQKVLRQLKALRELGWPKPTKARRPRKTRSDKGQPRVKSKRG